MPEPTALSYNKRDLSYQTFIVYTGLFLVTVFSIYSYFLWTGTSFIWESDGFTQHFQLFLDYNSKLREWMAGGGFPLWDWNIGLGADVIHSYGYYVIGDPFVYLGLLFPSHLMEAAYHVLVLLRVWAIGISFLFYLRHQGVSHYSGLAAAIAYSFTHFAIFNVTRHPFFLLPLIWYPLLCLGIEKILKGQSAAFFMLAVTASALSNFYFFYKLTLLTVLYALIRYFYLNKKKDWKSTIKVVSKASYAYAVGLLMSAVLFLPIVFGFLDSSRESGGMQINMLYYPLEYYLAMVQNVITPGSYFWLIGGLPIFSVTAMAAIWKKPGYRFIRTMVIVIVLLLLVPFFGSAMNGFSGPYNRFSFVLPFLFSAALAHFLDNRSHMIDADFLRKLKFVLVLLTFFSILSWMYFDENLPYMLFPTALGWGIWLYSQLMHKNKISYLKESRFIIGLVMINMVANALYYYHPAGMDASGTLIEYGTAEEEYQQVLANGQELLPDRGNEPYRVGVTSQDNHVRNQFLYLDVMGLNSYLSITNGYVTDFADVMETAGFQLIQPLRNGMDDRHILNQLLGVRYIITDAENEQYLPFGYEVSNEVFNHNDERYIIAETQSAHPLAYATGNTLSEDTFMALNAVEREAALANNAVLENEVYQTGQMEESPYDSRVKELAIDMISTENETVSLPAVDDEIEEEDTQFTLSIVNPDELIGHEWFIRFTGLDYQPFEQASWLRQPTNYRLSIDDGNHQKSIYQSDMYSFSSYFHRDNMLFNMGHVTENRIVDTVDITVDNPGMYTVDNIAVYAVPVDAQQNERLAEEKRERALQITTFNDDQVEGTISAEGNDVLVTSIPFSAGWSASVNEQDVPVLKTNIGFVGVNLESGANRVQLIYRTPFLQTGLILTLVGVGLFILYIVRWSKVGSKKNKEL